MRTPRWRLELPLSRARASPTPRLSQSQLAVGVTAAVVLRPGNGVELSEAIGSALYMAPEVEATKPYGLAADSFSFGAMAYEVASGGGARTLASGRRLQTV